MRPTTLAEAMRRAEESHPIGHIGYDLWKDLTRAYDGAELDLEILQRCEALGVDCSEIRRKIPTGTA